MQALLKKIQGDRVIWMLTLLLSLLSILAVYSSVSALSFKNETSSNWYLLKHTIMFGLGFAVMYVVHRIRFKYFSRVAQIAYVVAAVILLLTLILGPERNEAKRWLEIPFIGLTVQTSDFAKIALITYVARLLNTHRTRLHDFRNGVVPILVPILIICGLILPANFSTAAMLAAVCLLMMFLGGVPLKHMMRIGGYAVVLLALVFTLGKSFPNVFNRLGTWTSRIENFVSPEASADGNYQAKFAQVAIYKGGILPNGPGTSLARNYLPHSYSDMIYAFIIEEYGALLGGLGLVMVYLIFLFRCIRNAIRCPQHFGGLLTLGISFSLVTQALVNMAVSVRLFPMTGQPLPLVSMGGTSIIFTCFAIGMVLSVSRSVHNAEEYQKEGADDPISSNEIKNAYVA